MTSGSQHGAESGGGLVLCIHQSGSAGNAKFGLKHRIILFMVQSCTLPHLIVGSYNEDNMGRHTDTLEHREQRIKRQKEDDQIHVEF